MIALTLASDTLLSYSPLLWRLRRSSTNTHENSRRPLRSQQIELVEPLSISPKRVVPLFFGSSAPKRGMSSSSNYYSSGESFDLRYEALKCDCGLRAAIRVTESDKPSKGKRNCQFWKWCTPKSVTMVERLRNKRMIDQNQHMETVGLTVKNQMLEQSTAFMKQLVVGLLTICIVIMSTQEETQPENRKNKGKSSQVPSVKAH
ncbi:unnamed protein product [Camellia sinensis]